MSAGDRVRVNVGGTEFETTRTTLQPARFFDALLSERWGVPSPPLGAEGTQRQHVPFVDRSPHAFAHVLELLRDPSYPFPWSRWKQELVFYGISCQNELEGGDSRRSDDDEEEDAQILESRRRVALGERSPVGPTLLALSEISECDPHVQHLQRSVPKRCLPVGHAGVRVSRWMENTTRAHPASEGRDPNGRWIEGKIWWFPLREHSNAWELVGVWIELDFEPAVGALNLNFPTSRQEWLQSGAVEQCLSYVRLTINTWQGIELNGGVLVRRELLNDALEQRVDDKTERKSLLGRSRQRQHRVRVRADVWRIYDRSTNTADRSLDLLRFRPQYGMFAGVQLSCSLGVPPPDAPWTLSDFRVLARRRASESKGWKENLLEGEKPTEFAILTTESYSKAISGTHARFPVPGSCVLHEMVVAAHHQGVPDGVRRYFRISRLEIRMNHNIELTFEENQLLEEMAAQHYWPSIPVYCVSLAALQLSLARIDTFEVCVYFDSPVPEGTELAVDLTQEQAMRSVGGLLGAVFAH